LTCRDRSRVKSPGRSSESQGLHPVADTADTDAFPTTQGGHANPVFRPGKRTKGSDFYDATSVTTEAMTTTAARTAPPPPNLEINAGIATTATPTGRPDSSPANMRRSGARDDRGGAALRGTYSTTLQGPHTAGAVHFALFTRRPVAISQ